MQHCSWSATTVTTAYTPTEVGQTAAVNDADPNQPAVSTAPSVDERPEPADMPTSVLYAAAVESFIAFARTFDDDQWSTPVPCLPGWDVRDVLSHVAGVPDDGVAGRMDGAPGEAWTASQVKRNRDMAVGDLLDRWAEQYVAFGGVLDGIGEHRPPSDCHAHEHDIRHALGLAGNRDSLIVQAAEAQLARSIEAPVAVTVTLGNGRSFTTGDGDVAATLHGVSGFEIFRSRLGRRSRSQVEQYDWTGIDADVAAAIDAWFIFGAAASPVIEPGIASDWLSHLDRGEVTGSAAG
jgi:uncharacterized protein (TIGR03083 family)